MPRATAGPDTGPLIIDGHEDIAFNVLGAGRDYTRSVAETRLRDATNRVFPAGMGTATLGWPEWIAGRVGIIFATIFAEPARSAFGGPPINRYASADEARAVGLRQLQVYRSISSGDARFRLIRDRGDLEAVLDGWRGWPGPSDARPAGGASSRPTSDPPPAIGLVLLMENADPIRTPDELDEWYDAGLRILGPAWMASRYCGGTFEPGPLTPDGRQLLARMARRGMVLDTSHMAEASFDEAVECYPGPVIASHSNPQHFVPGDRHLTDAMIRALVARDGVIGHVPFNAFLVPDWRASGAHKSAANLATIVRAIDYICDLAGSARHVAFGSDLDGGFGAESTPDGLDTVADLQRISEALADRGYADADIEAIANGNWLRVLGRALPAPVTPGARPRARPAELD